MAWIPEPGSGGVSDHGELDGLADDDHLQYLTEGRHAAIDHGIVTDHGDLGGLGDDDHPQYLTEDRHDSHDHSTAIGSASVGDLADVDLTTPPDGGDALVWNGTAWVPGASGVSIVDPGTVSTVIVGGEVQVTASSNYGIDSNGVPYYDEDGAAEGEEAALGFDPHTGNFFLVPYH